MQRRVGSLPTERESFEHELSTKRRHPCVCGCKGEQLNKMLLRSSVSGRMRTLFPVAYRSFMRWFSAALTTRCFVGCPGCVFSVAHYSQANHRFQIFTGYHGQQNAKVNAPDSPEADTGNFTARQRTAAENARAAETVMLSGSANCPCCAGAA